MKLLRFSAFAVALSTSFASAATLRIADWNMGNKPNNTTDDSQLSTSMSYASAPHRDG